MMNDAARRARRARLNIVRAGMAYGRAGTAGAGRE